MRLSGCAALPLPPPPCVCNHPFCLSFLPLALHLPPITASPTPHEQGILLTPASESVLGGALGTDVLNTGGLVALTAGVAFQLYVASVNYAQNAPEGYNAVKDVRVSVFCGLRRGGVSAGLCANSHVVVLQPLSGPCCGRAVLVYSAGNFV